MSPQEKVLVLGAQVRVKGVHAYQWRGIPEGLDVSDYDVVILDFSTVAQETSSEDASIENLPLARDFARLIFTEGSTVVAIGDPATRLPVMMDRPFGMGASRVRGDQACTWWLPVELSSRRSQGDSIKLVEEDWQFWFDRVPRHNWHIVGSAHWAEWKQEALRAAVPSADGALAAIESIATTRAGEPIGFTLRIASVSHRGGGHQGTPPVDIVEAPCTVTWLPSPENMSSDERVAALLRHIVGIGVETPPPAWVHQYKLPRQREAEVEVARAAQAVREAEAALSEAKAVERSESRFAALLYEQGKDALEPLVRDALECVGAKVDMPARAGIEDARITAPTKDVAIVEIKGKRGQLKLDDVRQIDHWMRAALAEEGWEGKGLIVANLRLEERPEDREDIVAPEALKFAERVGIAILSTTQLHAALAEVHQGTFAGDAFWRAVFEARGLVDLPSARSTVEDSKPVLLRRWRG